MQRRSYGTTYLKRDVSAFGLLAMAALLLWSMASPASAMAFALCFPAADFEAQALTVGLFATSDQGAGALTLVDKSGRLFVKLRGKEIGSDLQRYKVELPGLEPVEIEANEVMALFVAVADQPKATGFALLFLGPEQGIAVQIGVVNGRAAPWETAARNERILELSPKALALNRQTCKHSLVHTRQMVEHARTQGAMKPLFDKD